MSNTIIKRIIKAQGLTHWRTKKRPELIEEVVAIRLAWALERRLWTVDQWRKYMWSDEYSMEWGKGKKRA